MSMLVGQLGEDMALMVSSVRRVLAAHAPWRLDADMPDWPMACADAWRQAAELGWLALRVPQAKDGLGCSLLEAALLMEEIGRALLPLPIADAVATAGLLGECAAAPVAGDAGDLGGWLSGQRCFALTASRETAGPAPSWAEFAASGLPALHAAFDGRVLRWWRYETDAPGVGIDPTIQTARLQSVPAVLVYEGACSPVQWRCYQWQRRLLRLAELLGVAQAAQDSAVRYARERQQFGRPIGANQALQHQLADAWLALDSAGLALQAACTVVWPDSGRTPRALLMAEYLVTQAARQSTALAIQVHGALGITWEADPQRYLKRLRHMLALPGTHEAAESLLAQLWHQGLEPALAQQPGVEAQG